MQSINRLAIITQRLVRRGGAIGDANTRAELEDLDRVDQRVQRRGTAAVFERLAGRRVGFCGGKLDPDGFWQRK